MNIISHYQSYIFIEHFELNSNPMSESGCRIVSDESFFTRVESSQCLALSTEQHVTFRINAIMLSGQVIIIRIRMRVPVSFSCTVNIGT